MILVETEYWDPSIDEAAPLIAYHDWYARGVGLLRSVTMNAHKGGKRMAEQSLESYEFPHSPQPRRRDGRACRNFSVSLRN